jgi:membrane-associated phospholipid phosphatase
MHFRIVDRVALRAVARPQGMSLNRLLPHEWLCLAFLVSLLLRLVVAVGFSRDSFIIASLLAINCGLLFFFPFNRDPDRSWRLRLLFYPIAMNLLYPVLRTAIPAVHPKLEDLSLQAVDRALIGTNLSLRLQSFVHPGLTDFLSFCYMLYFLYLLFGQAWYMFDDLYVLKKYYVGLFALYAVGYFGYSVLPALGPYLAMRDQFSTPLTGGWLTAANAKLVLDGCNRVDVFPSLHCGNSLFILLWDYQHKRWRFWAYLIPCVGLWVSTIYLRYHYFIDVVCGFLLGWLAWKMANREARKGLA